MPSKVPNQDRPPSLPHCWRRLETSFPAWFLVGLAYVSLFGYGLVDNARGPVYPDFLRSLSLNDASGSWFFFTTSVSAFATNLIFFKWIERIGAWRTTQVFSLVQVGALAIIGWSHDYAGTLVGCGFLGASMGGLGVAVNVLVAEGAPARFRRQAFAGLHCMYGLSSLFAPLLVTGLYHFGLDWRRTLGSLALAPLVVVAFSLRKPIVEAPAADVIASRSRVRSRAERVRAFGFAAVFTLYVVAEIAIGTRLALLARREGFALETANQLVSGFFLGLFIGRLLFAVFPLPLRSGTVLALSALASCAAAILGLLHHPGWLALSGLTMSVFYPYAISFINERAAEAPGEVDSHYVTSWSITLQSLGTMALHFSLGALSERFGLAKALWLIPLTLAATFVGTLFLLGKTRPPTRKTDLRSRSGCA